ncbi:unnamed protein product [Rhizoctonia solani]|uniref:F-box domain-containing protein n=1 Tax=Rhizoctonia solani TaxID=456999 RepID=A0A8H3CEV8_9AGAM|nr:unnamed protein product [Rhizoctonia solani]
MVEELNTTRSLLSDALDRYLDACLTIQQYHLEKRSLTDVPPELSPHVESEDRLTTELEGKLRKAKAAMRWSRNCSPSLVPIHKLPSDLLAHIFLLVVNLQSGLDWSGSPEVLAHVCSRWREVALQFPLLWRFISLPFTGSVETPQVDRAAFFASHAHPLHLYIRLNPGNRIFTTDNLDYPKAFAGTIAPHIRSLEVTSVTVNDFMERYQRSFLAAYFAQCKSGALEFLTLSHQEADPILFDITTDLPEYMESSCKALITGNLDQSLAPVTVLRATGLYPIWTSKAYHGLVELRLSRGGSSYYGGISISEKHLRGILVASPALRILEYSIAIVEVRSNRTPVPLDHLESLNVLEMPSAQLGIFWRLLAPGSKPIQLAIHNDDSAFLHLLQNEGGRSFFARSNVTSIYAKSLGYTCLSLLPDLCPHLKTLVLDGLAVALSYRWPTLETQIDSCTPHTQLEKLAIVGGFVDNDALPKLVDKFPALRNLSLWRCIYFPEFRAVQSGDTSNLVSTYLHVEVVDQDPVHDWEVFADRP